MNVTRINRSEREECAIKLREFANRISNGEISFAAFYVMDWNGKVDEVVMKNDAFSLEKTA